MTTSTLLFRVGLGLCMLATSAATPPNLTEPAPIAPPSVALVNEGAFHCPFFCIRCDYLLDAWKTTPAPDEECAGSDCSVNEQPCHLGGASGCRQACDESLLTAADQVDIAAFVAAANQEDVGALKQLLRQHPAKVKIDASRGAIQLMNRCNSSIVAHLPLSSSTIAALQAN